MSNLIVTEKPIDPIELGLRHAVYANQTAFPLDGKPKVVESGRFFVFNEGRRYCYFFMGCNPFFLDKKIAELAIKVGEVADASIEYFYATSDKHEYYAGEYRVLNTANIVEGTLAFTFLSNGGWRNSNLIIKMFVAGEYGFNGIYIESKKELGIKQLSEVLLRHYSAISYGISYETKIIGDGAYYGIGYSVKSLKKVIRKGRRYCEAWVANKKKVKNGYLRDIYQEQLLKEIHLNQKLSDGSTLKDFIDSSKEHGVLEKLDNDHFVWTVPEDKLKLVRKKLYKEPFVIVGDVMLEKMKKQG